MAPMLGVLLASVAFTSCNSNSDQPDAYGNIETTTTQVSAKTGGELLQFSVEEGTRLKAGQSVGLVDTLPLHLQKMEVLANKQAIATQNQQLVAQIEVQKDELANLVREEHRLEKLVAAKAAPSKQLDDMQGMVKVARQKLQMTRTQHPQISAKLEAMDAKLDQIQQQLAYCHVKNPINGTVLTKLAEPHEMVQPGKPLYRIAPLDTIEVRAYVTERQLHSLKLGQKVTVKIDGDEQLKAFSGRVSWISAEAEFTPKVIQTREERVDMVYAFKVRVPNNGALKIGMPAEVYFNETKAKQ